jgi:hypothetical protein
VIIVFFAKVRLDGAAFICEACRGLRMRQRHNIS